MKSINEKVKDLPISGEYDVVMIGRGITEIAIIVSAVSIVVLHSPTRMCNG